MPLVLLFSALKNSHSLPKFVIDAIVQVHCVIEIMSK
jgi:hypothetical protein